MKSCRLNGRTFHPPTKINQNYKPTDCYTSADCQYVADFEMSLARKQRNRVSFTKLAHLQDEVGDIVTVPHPYTNDLITVYITNLKRKYKPATLQEEGYFLDEIEGWIL